MAKHRIRLDASFSIETPQAVGLGVPPSVADANDQVLVRVRNLSSDNTSFAATIFDIHGTVPVGGPTTLQPEAGTNLFSSGVVVGSVNASATGTPNKTVSVVATKQGGGMGRPNKVDFEAVRGGSGSDGSGGSGGSGFAGVVTSCAPGESIPTTLYAHVSKAGARKGVYALAHVAGAAAGSDWSTDASCAPLHLLVRCAAARWQLTTTGKTYTAAHSQYGPFQILFHDVDLSGCGGGARASVEILVCP